MKMSLVMLLIIPIKNDWYNNLDELPNVAD